MRDRDLLFPDLARNRIENTEGQGLLSPSNYSFSLPIIQPQNIPVLRNDHMPGDLLGSGDIAPPDTVPPLVHWLPVCLPDIKTPLVDQIGAAIQKSCTANISHLFGECWFAEKAWSLILPKACWRLAWEPGSPKLGVETFCHSSPSSPRRYPHLPHTHNHLGEMLLLEEGKVLFTILEITLPKSVLKKYV